ncbi:hypothetical protein NE237_019260 [Protea cynaroides]|uniref:Uncharacterized protein n=1 Tax=Protea cynaroides TaxID=273540 RepID=A0A9Q0KBP4_9MAGN|nr:hypothetical protein NE237_019260 [Protea cynaroides]
MWSPLLVPKPNDWGPLVDVVGFCFLNLGTKYQPQEEFTEWLQDGPKPLYVGFGSMPLEDAQRTTNIIMEALKDTGQRGIIDRVEVILAFDWRLDHCGPAVNGLNSLCFKQSRWSEVLEAPENVFLLEDCPHDWLFPKCSAVVHHGGAGPAGTTATGLRAGVKAQAMELAKRIQNEDGVAAAVDAFH